MILYTYVSVTPLVDDTVLLSAPAMHFLCHFLSFCFSCRIVSPHCSLVCHQSLKWVAAHTQPLFHRSHALFVLKKNMYSFSIFMCVCMFVCVYARVQHNIIHFFSPNISPTHFMLLKISLSFYIILLLVNVIANRFHQFL